MLSGDTIRNGIGLEPVQTLCRRVIGKRVSPATLWRWVRRGTRAGRLEAVHVNGTWYTTADAFADFVNRQTAAQLGESARSVDIDDELRAAGLL